MFERNNDKMKTFLHKSHKNYGENVFLKTFKIALKRYIIMTADLSLLMMYSTSSNIFIYLFCDSLERGGEG